MADRIIRRDEVMARIGLGRTKLYDLINDGTFPKPVSLSARAVGWRESEVDAWIESRPVANTSAIFSGSAR